MAGSNHKTDNLFLILSRSNCDFLGIAVIFVLLSAMLSFYTKYDNLEMSSFQVAAETENAGNKPFIKNIVNTVSSNSNDDYIPFTINKTLPPRIVMVYNGTHHPGVLVSYKFRHGYTFGQLDIPAKKVTALLPADVVNVKKGSSVQFFTKENPSILPLSSLSVDAYTSQGKAVGVLNTTKSTSSTIALNLPEGKYILLATATWIPGAEDVTGYAIFSYMINIVP